MPHYDFWNNETKEWVGVMISEEVLEDFKASHPELYCPLDGKIPPEAGAPSKQ